MSGIRAWEVDAATGSGHPLQAMPPGTTLASGAAALDGLIWAAATAHHDPPGYSESTTPMLLAYDPPTNAWCSGPTPPRASVAAKSAVAVGGLLYFIGSTLTSTAGSAWVVVPDEAAS